MVASITIGVSPRERFAIAAESLESLLAHTGEPFELLYVDAAIPAQYRGQILGMLRDREATELIAVDRPLLPGQSKNLIVDRASGDYVCLVENDVLFTDGWLDQLLAACEEFPADVAAPIINEGRATKEHFDQLLGRISDSSKVPGKLEISPLGERRNEATIRHRVDLVEQHCLLFRADVFERIGRFDEELNTRDEIDLSLALWSKGQTVVLEPEAVVHYVPPSAPPEPDELDFYMMRWDLDRAIRSRERIREKWNLVETPGDLGFVRYRNLIPRLHEVRAELARLATRPNTIALVDDGDWFGTEVTDGLDLVPFPNRGGEYWGFPSSDDDAADELLRIVAAGTTHVVVGWPAFWWFDYLPGWGQRLVEVSRSVTTNELMRIYTLDSTSAPMTA
jgi:glycosyltransferase involved in cell wall biosynthesis